MIRFNKEVLRDKIYACWVGKNIGGTMGTPFEGKRELLDIQGFSTGKGVVLPNDDLDLQLVWMRAMDEMGPERVDAAVLGEYWASFIGPSWNEYGVGKSNLRAGMIPPLSGEMFNEEWKDSNGSWIRSEIWACTHPGCPDRAMKFAYADACVDHGYGEGTYASLFVTAMQSAAFVFDDLALLIEIGLSKIPEHCYVSKYVKAVRDAYKAGMDWKDCRNMIVAMNEETGLGWFQAPGNVAFTLIGLLYGEGDFKKSMIIGIDCADDTDCTGATIGSTLGIMHGMKIIPEDWREHIGDDIVTISIIKGHGYFPDSCTDLTNCVMSLMSATMRTRNPEIAKNGVQFELTDGESLIDVSAESMMGREFADELGKRARYSFEAENVYLRALVEYEKEPVIMAGESLKLKLSALLRGNMADQKVIKLIPWMPEGWTCAGRRSLHASAPGGTHGPIPVSYQRGYSTTELTITAGENVEGINRAVLELVVEGRPTPLLIPLTILG